MTAQEIAMPPHHRIIVNRFVEACQADERVVAAFISGSYARGETDAYSDLDFGLITTDEAYDDFFAGRVDFVRQLGEPIFLEGYHEVVCSIFSDGSEVDLGFEHESHFAHMYPGPYRVLLDKKGILTGTAFPWPEVAQSEQIKTLHELIYWFWHNLTHHFITPIARGQLWGAYGGLEDLRSACVNLARLRQNFSMEAEGYEKLEQAVPAEQLSPLQATFCPMEREAMLRAALVIVRYYRELVPSLAQAHGIRYPEELVRVMSERLEKLCEER